MDTPINTPCIPNVTKNGGIVKNVISNPFASPTTAPIASGTATPRKILFVAFRIIALTRPAVGTIPLIVRSIPPVASTKVIPTAITEIAAV